MNKPRELHVSEGRLRRWLARYLSPRVVELAMAELVENPTDAQDVKLTDEERARLRARFRGMLPR